MLSPKKMTSLFGQLGCTTDVVARQELRITTDQSGVIGSRRLWFGFIKLLLGPLVLLLLYSVAGCEKQIGDGLVIAAVRDGDIATVSMFIKCGGEINKQHMFGKTLLHHAASVSQLEVAQLLVDEDANIEAVDDFGYTPLHWAAARGHIDMVHLLISAGADMEADSHYGSPLCYAAMRGHGNVAKLLLDAGADIQATKSNAESPLHWAVDKDQTGVISLLLDEGADLTATKGADGLTPLDRAREFGSKQVVELLENYLSGKANQPEQRKNDG